MSYILDALKKADKERKRGTVPNLSTVQEPTPHKSKKRSLWPYIIVLAIFLNAGIILMWLRPWESKETTIVAKSPVVITHESPTVSSHEFSDIKSHSAIKSTQPEKATPSGINNSEEKAPPELQTTMTPKKSVDTQQQKQTIPSHTERKDKVPDESSKGIQTGESYATSSDESTISTTETTTSDQQRSSTRKPSGLLNKSYDLESLPSSIKENIPDINISVFVYSDDPASRVVKINGQTVREGQELADGLEVEKIVPDGVIFNYEDYRFRVGIK